MMFVQSAPPAMARNRALFATMTTVRRIFSTMGSGYISPIFLPFVLISCSRRNGEETDVSWHSSIWSEGWFPDLVISSICSSLAVILKRMLTQNIVLCQLLTTIHLQDANQMTAIRCPKAGISSLVPVKPSGSSWKIPCSISRASSFATSKASAVIGSHMAPCSLVPW